MPHVLHRGKNPAAETHLLLTRPRTTSSRFGTDNASPTMTSIPVIRRDPFTISEREQSCQRNTLSPCGTIIYVAKSGEERARPRSTTPGRYKHRGAEKNCARFGEYLAKPMVIEAHSANSMLPKQHMARTACSRVQRKGPQGKGGKTYGPLTTTRPGNASGSERHTAVRIIKSLHRHTLRVTRTLVRRKERTTSSSALCHTIDQIIWHFTCIEVSTPANILREKRPVVLAWQQRKVQ